MRNNHVEYAWHRITDPHLCEQCVRGPPLSHFSHKCPRAIELGVAITHYSSDGEWGWCLGVYHDGIRLVLVLGWAREGREGDDWLTAVVPVGEGVRLTCFG